MAVFVLTIMMLPFGEIEASVIGPFTVSLLERTARTGLPVSAPACRALELAVYENGNVEVRAMNHAASDASMANASTLSLMGVPPVAALKYWIGMMSASTSPVCKGLGRANRYSATVTR